MQATPSMSSQVEQEDWMHDIATHWSTKTFFIEYGNCKPNRLTQTAIALKELGASKELVLQFVEAYKAKLEPAALHLEREIDEYGPPDTITNFQITLLGTRRRFYALVDFYSKSITSKGLLETIQRFFHVLAPGMSGSAFHGLSHLGYGVHSRNARVVAEGLAYMHFASIWLGDSLSKTLEYARQLQETCKSSSNHENFREFFGKLDTLLSKIKAEKKLDSVMDQSFHHIHHPKASLFEKRLKGLSSPTGIALLNAYLDEMKSCENLFWLVDACILIFLRTCTTETYESWLVNCICGAWALGRISGTIEPMFASECFLKALLASYAAQGYPVLVSQEDLELEFLSIGTISWDGLSSTIRTHGDEHSAKVAHIASYQSQNGGTLSMPTYLAAASWVLRKEGKEISTPPEELNN